MDLTAHPPIDLRSSALPAPPASRAAAAPPSSTPDPAAADEAADPTRARAAGLGLALVLAVLFVQVPFGLLAARFDYPDILRAPAGVVLARFREGGAGLIACWYVFAASVVPLAVAMIRAPHALALSAPRRSLAVAAAATSGAAQLIGLLRWTFVVPILAAHAAQAGPGSDVGLVFEVQHQLFGVLLGEHVGQLTLAAWTWVVFGAAGLPRGLRWVGRGSAALVGLGLVDGWATVGWLGIDVSAWPVVGFVAWTVAVLGLGAHLATRGGHPSA